MSISRLQLAAALIEYDNDPSEAAPAHRRARDSALFKPFQPRPLDGVVLPTFPSNTPSDAYPGPSADFHPQPQGALAPSLSHSLPLAPLTAAADSDRLRSSPHADSSNANANRGVTVDVSRWGIPPHLVASPMSPSASASLASPNPGDASLPVRVANPLRLRPEPIASPLQDRALSVHLDILDGLAEHTDAMGMEVLADGPSVASPSGPFDRPSGLDQPRALDQPRVLDQPSRLDEPRVLDRPSVLNRPRHDASVGAEAVEARYKGEVQELRDEVQEVLSRAERIRQLAQRPHTVIGHIGQTESSGISGANRRTVTGSGRSSPPVHTRRRRPSSFMALTEDLLSSDYPVTEPIMVPLPSSPSSSYFSAPLSRPQSRLSHSGSRISSPVPYPGSIPYPPSSSVPATTGAEQEQEEYMVGPNPFALPAPPVELGSRFDPKVLEAQRRGSLSSVTDLARDVVRRSMLEMQDRRGGQDRPTSRPPSMDHARSSMFMDDRRISRLLDPSAVPAFPDIPDPQEYGRPLQASKYRPRPKPDRQSLLRPKTLIMPVSLANQADPPQPSRTIPEGYMVGDKPLPAGARSSILVSGSRPSLPLSLSQRTFRSSLVVGGQRDPDFIGGTELEGEEGLTTPLAEEMGEAVEGVGEDMRRKPGRLYGTSLIDQLEARKAAMRGKQRVFSGDSRPAMMARKSTLMDPNSLAQMLSGSATSPNLARPTSLLSPSYSVPQLQGRGRTDDGLAPTDPRMSKSKSVFGVDQIWEREMAKLKVLQEAEARRLAEEETRAALEGTKKAKGKGKKKDKGKGRAVEYSEVPVEEPDLSPVPHVAELPPTIDYSPENAALSRELASGLEADQVAEELGASSWFKDDADGGEGRGEQRNDSDVEDDVPLSKMAPDSVKENDDDDSDDEVPLSTLAKQVSPTGSAGRPLGLGALPTELGTGFLGLLSHAPKGENDDDNDEDDEDDIPLALRRPKSTLAQLNNAPSGAEKEAIEDDLPLGYKHAEAATRQSLAAQAQAQAQVQTQAQAHMPIHSQAQIAGEWWLLHQQQEEAMRRATLFGYGMMPPYADWNSPHAGYPYAAPASSMSTLHLPALAYSSGPMPTMPTTMPAMPAMRAMVGMGDMVSIGLGGMEGMGMVPPPQFASQNIDNWRKDVAVAPVSTGSGSASGAA